MQVDVQDLDVDFFAFSGHKVYGPTGVGVLWKEEWLDKLPPIRGGGEMIQSVSFEKPFNELPLSSESRNARLHWHHRIGEGARLRFGYRL